MTSKRSPDETLTNSISKKARPELTEIESKIIFRGGNVVEWLECKDATRSDKLLMLKFRKCKTVLAGPRNSAGKILIPGGCYICWGKVSTAAPVESIVTDLTEPEEPQ